jgi:tetratricopeptide (TPR) repeat protein
MRKYESAAKILSELKKEAPADEQILYFLGMSLLRSKKLLEGRGVLNELLIKHPSDKELVGLIKNLDDRLKTQLRKYAVRINQSLRNKEWDQALQLTLVARSYNIDGSLDLNHNIPFLRNVIALNLIENEKRSEAIEIWSRALRECPPNLVVLHDIAIAHWFNFKKFISANPSPLDLKKKWSSIVDYLTLTFANPAFWEKVIAEKEWLTEDSGTVAHLAQSVVSELTNRITDEVTSVIAQRPIDARDILLSVWRDCQADWELKRRANFYAQPLFTKCFEESFGSAEDIIEALEAISCTLKDSRTTPEAIGIGNQRWNGELVLIQSKIGFDMATEKVILALSGDNSADASKLMKEIVELKVSSFDGFPRFSKEVTLQTRRIFDSGKKTEALEIADLLVKMGYTEEILKYCSSLYRIAGMEIVANNPRRATRLLEKAVLYDLSSERARKDLSVCYSRLANAKNEQKDHLSTAKFLELSMISDPLDEENKNLAKWVAFIYNKLGVELSYKNDFAAATQYFKKAIMFQSEENYLENLRRTGGSISSFEHANTGIDVDPSKILNYPSFSAMVFQKWVHDAFRRARWLMDAGKFQSFSFGEKGEDADFVPQDMFLPHSSSCQTMVRIVHRLYTMIKRGQCEKAPVSGRVGFNPELISREDTESHNMFRNEVIRIYHETEWELFTSV